MALEPRMILLAEPIGRHAFRGKGAHWRANLDLNEEVRMTVMMIEHGHCVVMSYSHRVM